MKVLFVVTSFPSPQKPNSGPFNIKAAKQLGNIGDVRIIKLRAWIPGRKFRDQYSFNGIPVTCISLPYGDIKYMLAPFFSILIMAYKRLSYHLLKRLIFEHDIIHSVGIGLPGIICSYWSKKQKKKHIAQIVGTDVNYRIGLIKQISSVKGWEISATYMVGNSHSLVKEFMKHYPDFPKEKTAVVYRGINLQEFNYSIPSCLDSEIVFLFLGGISEKGTIAHGRNFKGIITLIQAWKLLSEKNLIKPPSIKLLIGGPRTNDNKYLMKLIHDTITDRSIEIIGSLNIVEVKEYMEKSAVIIVPSMAEGLPNVALEAAAIGRPVIASNVGGIPELVLHNETGFLFEPGNANELAYYMRILIEEPEMIREFGKSARKRVVEQFDSIHFASKYLELYES